MRVAAVDSTTLLTVSYDEAQALMQLEFCSRAVYQYFRVPAEVHQSLLAAPSKGRYFNQAIRGHFRYCLISDFDATLRCAERSARCDR